MSKILEKLKGIPIPIDKWAYRKVGRFNEGSFKKDFQKLRVMSGKGEADNLLVDVSKFGLVSSDYYLDKYFLGNKRYQKSIGKRIVFSRAFLRRGHAIRLAKVDSMLRKEGLFLFIVSGWRHPKIQELAKNEYAEQFGEEKANQLFASTDWKVPPPHSTGAAFDLEIRSLSTGEPLNMTIFFGGQKIFSLYYTEELFAKNNKLRTNKSFKEAVENRRILYHLLCSERVVLDKADLFVAHPGEFWHYGDGDTLSSFLRRKKYIKYGLIYPKDDILIASNQSRLGKYEPSP